MEADNKELQGKNEYLQYVRKQPPHCANCDIDILWQPTVMEGKTFCCTGCAAGGPCSCDYSLYRSANIAGTIHYLD
ncbi:MAG: hypothetical protein NVSMB27_18850 [Ktedonobacteraceae bacterium]